MIDFFKQRIILYGAGYAGAMFAELLQVKGIKPICFFDADIEKNNTMVMNISVQQPCRMSGKEIIIVCMLKKDNIFDGIRERLIKLGFEKIFHIYDLRDEKWLFENQNLIIAPREEIFWKNKKRFQRLEERLEDEKSKIVLKKIQQFIVNTSDIIFPAEKIQEQYFAYDIYKKIDNECFVDCGGFKGEVMNIFLKNNKDIFEQYTIIEPDKNYLPYIQKKIKSHDEKKIKIINCALSDKREILHLKNYANENSVIKEDGKQMIEAYTLDQLLYGEKCTFLKIDVEGYEKKTLIGARTLICKQRPIIAVATYHHEEDFVDLFELIDQLFDGYYFYLRSYMNIQETVLYAIPEWRLCKRGEG